MKVLLVTIEQDPPSLKSYSDELSIDGDTFSRGFKEIVRLCLQKDPKKRPNCNLLINHKFLKSKSKDTLVSQLLDRIDCVGTDEGIQNTPRPQGTSPAYIMNQPGGEGRRPSTPRTDNNNYQKIDQNKNIEKVIVTEENDEKSENIPIASGVVLDTSKIVSQTPEINGDINVHNNSVNQNVNIDDQSTENIGMQHSTEEKSTIDQKEYVAGTTWVFDDGSQVILKPTNSSMIEDDDPESFYHEFENTTGGENYDKIKQSASQSLSSNQQDSIETSSSMEHDHNMKEVPIIQNNEASENTKYESTGIYTSTTDL